MFDAQLSAHPLVGRADELVVLERALGSAVEGQPQLVVVEGAAGVGKSALLRAFARSVKDRVTVLRASGDEGEQHLDFGLIEQLHADGEASDVPVMTAFGRSGPRPEPLDIGADLVRVSTEASAFLPVVALIDDAQWADQASLQALTFALRRFRNQRLLTVIAQRTDVPALGPLRRLCQDERGTLVQLGGLAPAQLATLLHDARGISLGERAALRLREHTRGNPLEALILADELDAETISAGLGPLPAPRSYATLALNRLAACSAQAERLVAAVAVLGSPVEVGRLADLLALRDPAAVADPLDEAVTGGHLVVESRAGRRLVEVAHPLLRAAVVADLAPGVRCELHARAAAITDDPVRAMLHRLSGTIGHDPTLGAEAVALARERLNTGWDLTAVQLLSAASGVLPDGPPRAEALLLAANRLFTTGELQSARRLLNGIDDDTSALGLLVRGQDLMHRGDPRGARAALKIAWERATDPRVAGQVAGLLATLASNTGLGSDAIRWAHAALQHADVSGSELGNAFVMLATGSAFDGDLQRGLVEIDRALAQVGPRFDRNDALLARGLLLLWTGELGEAEATFDTILEAGEEPGPLLTRVSAGYSRADCRYRRGSWDAALAEAEELVALMEAGDHNLVRPMAHGVAAFVHAGRGAAAQAERHLAEGRAAQVRSDNTSGLLWLMVGEARIGSASDDHQRVVDHLGPLADMLRGSQLGEGVQPWRADLVEALVGLGRLDDATEALAELDQRFGAGGEQARVGAARARGLLAAALGDDESAEDAFADGLDQSDDGGPFMRARLQLAAGAFARRRGRRRQASDLLTAALDRFEALGAKPYAARTRAELEACGLAPRQRNDDGQTPLSPAERQVAELVAVGLTNREVATRLHVSVKTVETHVARCFAKLNVRNRTALSVRWADQASATESGS